MYKISHLSSTNVNLKNAKLVSSFFRVKFDESMGSVSHRRPSTGGYNIFSTIIGKVVRRDTRDRIYSKKQNLSSTLGMAKTLGSPSPQLSFT